MAAPYIPWVLLALFVLFQARPSLSGHPGRALGNAAPPPSTVPAEEPTGDAPEVWKVEKEEAERDKSLQPPEPDKQPLSSPPPPTTAEEPKTSAAEATVKHDAPAEPVQQTTETALPVEPTASAGQAELRAFREALQEIKTYIDDKSMVLKEIKTFMDKMASPPDVAPAIQKALEPLTGLTDLRDKVASCEQATKDVSSSFGNYVWEAGGRHQTTDQSLTGLHGSIKDLLNRVGSYQRRWGSLQDFSGNLLLPSALPFPCFLRPLCAVLFLAPLPPCCFAARVCCAAMTVCRLSMSR